MGKKNKESPQRITKYFKDGIVDYHSISCHVRYSQTLTFLYLISVFFVYSIEKKKLEEICSRWRRRLSFSPSDSTTNDSSF